METLRLLVTDDEADMRRAVDWALRDFTVRVPDTGTEAGLVVEQAATGEEALERVRTDAPDILLLDHKLPGISGLEVLDQLAGLQSDMLTIMITAYASIETAVIATRRGAYDFLAKPFTPEELKSTIRKAIIRVILAKQARRLAEENKQVRFQFIRVLGHELKSPLSAIDGYLQIMASHAVGEDIKAYDHAIQRCRTRVAQMRKLIADLLDMTRIESGLKNREVTRVDVAAVARNAIETMTADAAARDIRITLHDQGVGEMTADPQELEMIFNNLVSNAVKYNKDGGSVDVTLSRDGHRVIIRVSDTGIGLTKEDAAKLFRDFVRIRDARTRTILGSGLGLSIVRKLAQLYDGDASVTSEPGAGSTFTVVLNDTAGVPQASGLKPQV
ncbi:MAG TPA: hybrid sensor histidine kinase/response regulator [Phycisphaerae bacterium]|nr:hybrid sensor histidine kinase/response regulator [Phycisphaerae bacterium]HOJ73677.1 hybrid sensor histidine kinase/response regulator [Phycisphaerae bacterium]HOM50324.1 hybrid sensor histidine kinase/response regulator [Phycisphaerae bacterium]HON67000.1 hybrid sensor histidine kinase/response regulator [Phycisphaerae bacterium]HOQ84951.1 hybrid sensor histidine kinase/response regulator [Phycisphaerae bacterium]